MSDVHIKTFIIVFERIDDVYHKCEEVYDILPVFMY